jgi:biopolymer transport protein ExbB/TolQ
VGVYVLVGAILVGVGSFALLGLQRRRYRNQKETLEDRVSRLQSSLMGAAGVVAEIEREVASRQELLSKLEEDAKRVRALAGMDREEVDAVTQALNGQLAQLEKRSLRGSIILSSIFYVLGIASGILTNIFIS